MYRTTRTGRVRTAVLVIAVLALVPAAAAGQDTPGQETAPPEGVQQLRPRGGIPAIFDPVFVTAAEAQMPDSAWVLGLVINGEARAYDLNILNHHEVVNDVVGGLPVAPVW